MKHFYVSLPDMPPEGYRTGDRVDLSVQETDDENVLGFPGCIYLGSVDSDGNNVTALTGLRSQDPAELDRAEIEGMLSSIRGPFFKATVVDGMQGDVAVPCV